MEIKLLGSPEIIKEKWDDLILNSEEGNVYACFGYLSKCERNWQAVILISAGSYLAAIPLQYSTSFFQMHIYQDPFAHELGLFKRENIERSLVEKMFQLAFDNSKLVSAYFFNVDNSPLLEDQKVLKKGKLFQKATYHLNLKRPYDEIHAAYATNRKRDLKKARKHQQYIYTSTDLSPLISIFKEFTAKKMEGL